MDTTQDLLNQLANLYDKTQGATFQIYRSKRGRLWRIRVLNKPFDGIDIDTALKKAIDYIKKNRTKTDIANEYSLYK